MSPGSNFGYSNPRRTHYSLIPLARFSYLPVHAIIPLSLLEALRNLDTPVEDGLEELAGEIVSKRLGLSCNRGRTDHPISGRGQKGRPGCDR